MRKPDDSEKHTLKNARATGDFCFNVVTLPLLTATSTCASSIRFGRLNGFLYATLGDILERPFNDGSAR